MAAYLSLIGDDSSGTGNLRRPGPTWISAPGRTVRGLPELPDDRAHHVADAAPEQMASSPPAAFDERHQIEIRNSWTRSDYHSCPYGYNQSSMKQYVALLRGINVGGKNLIKMTDLKTSFEALGFENVSTYIQSGNVLFSAAGSDQAKLTKQIEEALSKSFNYESRVVARSHKQIKEIVAKAPKGFGSDQATYRYDVIFLKDPLTAVQAMKSVSMKDGVDQVFTGKGVLYFSRLISKASSSHLTRIIGMPVYQSMTIRNWNTTTKLLNLMDKLSN